MELVGGWVFGGWWRIEWQRLGFTTAIVVGLVCELYATMFGALVGECMMGMVWRRFDYILY